MMENDEGISSFFSKRAKFVPKRTPEEIKAALELMNKFQEEEKDECVIIPSVEKIITSQEKKTTRRSKRFKSRTSEEKKDGTSDILDVELSAASKRKLRKLREEQELERQMVEAENRRILSGGNEKQNYSAGEVDEIAEEFEKITVLTINYISKVSRLRCYENDKFVHIFPKVAELFNIKASEFLLCHREKTINVDDTPKSLNLSSHDVLECIPYKAEDSSKVKTTDLENSFKIVFQSSDSKTKIDMLVHKVEKMQDVMKRYSDLKNIPLEQLVFDFDGERLSGSETPADLDMEPGNCVDVTILVDPINISSDKEIILLD